MLLILNILSGTILSLQCTVGCKVLCVNQSCKDALGQLSIVKGSMQVKLHWNELNILAYLVTFCKKKQKKTDLIVSVNYLTY